MIIHLSQLLMLNIEDSKTALFKKNILAKFVLPNLFLSYISIYGLCTDFS